MPSAQDIKRFCEIIVKHLGDHDLVHEIVMQISPYAASEVYSEDADILKRIMSGFVDFVCSQGWPFNYTDKIGRKCHTLYNFLEDPILRAHLLYCVTEVGLNHNRYCVINIMQELFHKDKSKEEWVEIERRFLDDETLRYKAGAHLNLSKLPSSIVSLFCNDED